jgi:delta 1-pyrroline-5-carboxylate dehydrogenase
MLVSEKNYDKAVKIAIASANSTTVGDPNGEFRIGPIANKTQYEKIIKLIEIGIEEGATLVAGGAEKPDGCEKGYFIRPTVFANVTNDMTIAKEEIFGPVLVMTLWWRKTTRRGVIMGLLTGFLVTIIWANIPYLRTMMTPRRVVFLHHKVITNTGPNAEPKPLQA